jgi:hypothetical protein
MIIVIALIKEYLSAAIQENLLKLMFEGYLIKRSSPF